MIVPSGILSSKSGYLISLKIYKLPFKKMIEEMSSILWGLSLAANIILMLIGLPLCLLICCCCRKHQDAFEKDIRMLAKNHNILQGEEPEVRKSLPPPQRKRIRVVKTNPVKVQSEPSITELEDEQDDIQQLDDSNYQMEDE